MKWSTDEFTGRHFGKYEVLCRLAVGGMAEIFLGFARSGPLLGRAVVLKRILPEQREDPVALRMLLDEAKLTATLSHPNVAQVLDLERDGEDVVLVIEFIAGANAEEVVDAYREREEPVPLGFALAACREAAQGLAHAHGHRDARGAPMPIIHRDVTPRNVMVDFAGAIKVLDFGIARAKGSERRTQVGMVRGTTAYMSPEQAIDRELDVRTDLFSLGVVCHELLTGQRLFYKGNPAQEMAAVYEGEIPLPSRVNRRVPRALDPVVMRALERKLDRRYQSALEFIRDLSLAAGSTMWSRERCGEMARAQFADRQADIERLLARIPAPPPDAADMRTQISRGGPLPTLVEGGRAPVEAQAPTWPGRAGPPPREAPVPPRREAPAAPEPQPRPAPARAPTAAPLPDLGRLAFTTDPGRPGTPPELAMPTEVGRGPVTDAGARVRGSRRPPAPTPDELGPAEETRIVAGSRQLPAPVVEQGTDPGLDGRGERGAASWPLVLAAVVALLLGAAGGALIFKLAQRPSTASMVRVLIDADRPADVALPGQAPMGRTPFTAVFPVGHHVLQFREDGGTLRAHEFDVQPGAENAVSVRLDALPAAP